MKEFILSGNYWAEKGDLGTEDWVVLYRCVEKNAAEEIIVKLKSALDDARVQASGLANERLILLDELRTLRKKLKELE